MATQTKADRREAAQKAAATRERNQVREESRAQGTKAASTRQANEAVDRARDAKRALSGAASGIRSAATSTGGAVIQAGKAVATRATATVRGR
jgi:hypothetical protein